MSIDRKLNSRKAIRLCPDGRKEPINPEDIKAGMNIYMFEQNGKPVEQEGIRLFHVTKDAVVLENGVVKIEHVPFS